MSKYRKENLMGQLTIIHFDWKLTSASKMIFSVDISSLLTT